MLLDYPSSLRLGGRVGQKNIEIRGGSVAVEFPCISIDIIKHPVFLAPKSLDILPEKACPGLKFPGVLLVSQFLGY